MTPVAPLMSVLAPFTTELLDRRAPSPVERRFTMLLTANVDLTERTKGELRRRRTRTSEMVSAAAAAAGSTRARAATPLSAAERARPGRSRLPLGQSSCPIMKKD